MASHATRLASLLKRLKGEADEERQKAPGRTIPSRQLRYPDISRQPHGVPGVGTSRGAESQGTVCFHHFRWIEEIRESILAVHGGWLTMVHGESI